MTRTGYFFSMNGTLRHAHPIFPGGTTPQWHNASHRHSDYPDAHTIYQSWNQATTMWAKANANLTPDQKAQLIEAAHRTHEEI